MKIQLELEVPFKEDYIYPILKADCYRDFYDGADHVETEWDSVEDSDQFSVEELAAIDGHLQENHSKIQTQLYKEFIKAEKNSDYGF